MTFPASVCSGTRYFAVILLTTFLFSLLFAGHTLDLGDDGCAGAITPAVAGVILTHSRTDAGVWFAGRLGRGDRFGV